MSNVHILQVEDQHGDLVDLLYWHHGCAPADVLGWPAPEALDYPVHCEACGDRVREVPLSEYDGCPGTDIWVAHCETHGTHPDATR